VEASSEAVQLEVRQFEVGRLGVGQFGVAPLIVGERSFEGEQL
jgi:hypothetical protein